jgi:hypothetical protein
VVVLAPALLGFGLFLGVPSLYARVMTLVVGFAAPWR